MSSKNRTFSLGLGILVILGLFLYAPAAWSDWDPADGHKMHYPQLPDLDNGIDVETSTTIADDFQCTSSGPITDIHIWVSYFEDVVWEIPLKIQIWDNISTGPNGFSTPGVLLWTRDFQPEEYEPRDWATGLNETFWDPLTGASSTDTAVYQLNFFIDPEEAFYQEEGEIYWLSVFGNMFDPATGWKTSDDHFMDYAVFKNATEDWERIYYNGEYRDMAFVITPIPPSLLLLGSGLLGLGALGWRRKKQG